MKCLNEMKTAKDIINVSISNIAKLLSGVLVGFILPKILGVEDYGYYKTFTLYATYVGLFHFGLSDGIYLKFGGENYEDLDKREFRFYTIVFCLIELIVSVILIVITVANLKNEYKFIFICLAVYLIFNNVTSYYQMISQITGHFKELSIRNIIQAFAITSIVLFLWTVQKQTSVDITYRIYTILYILTMAVLMVWYIGTYRDITFGEITYKWVNIPILIKIGLPLTIANLCSSLILTLDRQFVNVLFDTATYAVYAFAYNLLSLVTTATSAISVVLYPKLRRTDINELDSIYHVLIGLVLGFIFGCLILYFPLCIFIRWFLPKYEMALPIFRVIFPGLAISSAITIVIHNYYKIIGVNTRFFYKTIIILLLSCVANAIAYTIFKTTIWISIASIITMVIWYIVVEHYLIKNRDIKWKKNFTYMMSMMISFYFSTVMDNYYGSMIVYIVLFVALSYLFYRKQISSFIRKKL